MTTTNKSLAALLLLTQLLERAARLGDLIRAAQAAGREVNDADLDSLGAEDDAARVRQIEAIEAKRIREGGRARTSLLGVVALVLCMVLATPVLIAGEAPTTVTSPQISDGGEPRSTVLSWTAPTTYIDGSPITEVISYNIYEGLCTLTTLPKVLGPLTQMTVTRLNQPAGVMCYQVTAQTPLGGESARTTRGSKTFPWPAPNTAPTLTIQ